MSKIQLVPSPGDDSTTCKHYSGHARSEQCRAGIAYADVKTAGEVQYRYKNKHGQAVGSVYTRMYSIPCFSHEGAKECPKREFYTDEEIAEFDRQTALLFEKTDVARKAILEHAGGKKGVKGKLPCPVCKKGTLMYSIAGSNGHVHAQCTVDSCVSWME